MNKQLQWQMKNFDRDLRFVQLNTFSFRFFIFTDVSFVNNENLFSQIEFVIVLVDKFNKINLIHWSSIKCKRVTRSVLVFELYAMIHEFDFEIVLKSTINLILNTSVFIIICTDSKSLYECLMKLKNTQKKTFHDRCHVFSSIVQTSRNHEDKMNWRKFQFGRCDDQD